MLHDYFPNEFITLTVDLGDAHLPVEVDTDVGPHVFGTEGQDLKDRETPGDTVQSWTQSSHSR